MHKPSVTPWEVTGQIEYTKLTKEFGTQLIDDKLLQRIKKHTGELHHFLTRQIFFSHRDMNWLLDKYEQKEPFVLYTGRAPSGKVHLGHLVPWIFAKWLQEKFDAHLYFQFPDEEKFLFKENLTLEDTEKLTYDNALDVIALGFKPNTTTFLVDTKHANTMYKEAVNIAKRITFSTAKAAFGFENETNIGAIFYTAMQAVPAILPSVIKGKNVPCLIPLGIDQDPHFRVARDVYPKLGFYKPAMIHCRFLPPLTGIHEGKMSSSQEETAIFTTDSADTVKKKIHKYAFSGGQATVEEHRKKGGNPGIDISYQWLTFLEENDARLKKVYDNYSSGAMLTSEIKLILTDKINKFLKHHQEKREKARDQVEKFFFNEKR